MAFRFNLDFKVEFLFKIINIHGLNDLKRILSKVKKKKRTEKRTDDIEIIKNLSGLIINYSYCHRFIVFILCLLSK